METLMKRALDIAHLFDVPRGEMACEPYGTGNINDTFCLTVRPWTGAARRYILQRVNRYVFPDPEPMMGNIQRVTHYLRGVIARGGGDPARETLTLVRAMDGRPWITDVSGDLWRVYLFIEGTVSTDMPDSPEMFAAGGEAFGRFQRQLGGFDAATLHPTLPDFHNTPARLQQLTNAIGADVAGRRAQAGEEIAFCMARAAQTDALLRELEAGNVPLRVTHNDTKMDNVLLDEKTGRGVCIIDLDTVMPGLSAWDFGDAVRTGANTAGEDERDLSRVAFSLPMFKAYVSGYLRGLGGELTRRELDLLPLGAKLMTLECGMRFLTDHLNGDRYFHIHREGHNLDRARTQFRLVECMEKNWDAMVEIVKNA